MNDSVGGVALDRAKQLFALQCIAAEDGLRTDRAQCACGIGASSESEDFDTLERALITRVLEECEGNKSLAAARLGISRTQLYVRLRRHQML